MSARRDRPFRTWVLLCTAAARLVAARAATPEIAFIEWHTNEVWVHFDTEAHRGYTLQYKSSLLGPGEWSNLFIVQPFIFDGHYIVVDKTTAPQRFYRLSVTP